MLQTGFGRKWSLSFLQKNQLKWITCSASVLGRMLGQRYMRLARVQKVEETTNRIGEEPAILDNFLQTKDPKAT